MESLLKTYGALVKSFKQKLESAAGNETENLTVENFKTFSTNWNRIRKKYISIKKGYDDSDPKLRPFLRKHTRNIEAMKKHGACIAKAVNDRPNGRAKNELIAACKNFKHYKIMRELGFRFD